MGAVLSSTPLWQVRTSVPLRQQHDALRLGGAGLRQIAQTGIGCDLSWGRRTEARGRRCFSTAHGAGGWWFRPDIGEQMLQPARVNPIRLGRISTPLIG
jgi:hypothetical protein